LLGQLPQKILTARVHTTMLERGDERFGISPEQTRTVLRELAAEQQIQIITEDEALQHIESLVDEYLGEALRLETDVRNRILKEGNQWGLSSEQIELIIKQRSRKNYKKRQAEQNLSNAALVAAMVAVLLVMGFLGWAMLGGRMTPVEPTPSAQPITSSSSTPADDSDEHWWSVELVLAIHNATSEFPLLRRTLKAIASPTPEHRANSYDAVIQHALWETDDNVKRNMLLNVISQAYVVEPDESVAEKIRRKLADAVPGPEDRLSERAADYPAIFWSMRVAVAALHASQDHADRADAMARTIGRVVGTTIDREQPHLQLERQCLGALAERLFRLMITSAASHPEGTLPRYQVIADEAGRYLERSRLERLHADFLGAYLPESDDAWHTLEAQIDATVANRDPLIVAKLVDVYETTNNSSLQSYLESRLLLRANVRPKASEAPEIANEIRQALGITEVATSQGRTQDFIRHAARELAWSSPQTDDRMKAIDVAARLSHVATLGCALAQGEPGFPLFDDLIKQEPAILKSRSRSDDDLFPTDVGTDWDALEQIDRALSRLRTDGSANRVNRIETIGGVAGRVQDLSPAQAKLLAEYLLTPKSNVEHERVLEVVPKFQRWGKLHLAIADAMYDIKMERDQLRTTLSQLLDEEIRLGDGEAGRELVRGALLRRAIDEVGSEAASVADPNLVDRASDILLEQYRRQATLQGVAPAALAEAANPADVLTALIEHYSTRLTAAGLDKLDTIELKEIPNQLVAIEYVADNSLQQTVLLERVWLRLVATDLKHQIPSASDEANRIIRDLVEADQTAGNAIHQLRSSQTALVHMWMLWNRSK